MSTSASAAGAKRLRSARTRQALVQAGRRLFTERGYAGASTEDLVQAAGVTRGALYHHFRDKRDLFRAVLEDLCHELWARGRDLSRERARAAGPRSLERSEAAAVLALDLFLDPGLRQVLAVEGPSVLGWREWRAVIEQHFLVPIRGAIREQIALGQLPADTPDHLADLVFGAVLEAGLLIAHADDPRSTRRDVGRALVWLVERFRPQASSGG